MTGINPYWDLSARVEDLYKAALELRAAAAAVVDEFDEGAFLGDQAPASAALARVVHLQGAVAELVRLLEQEGLPAEVIRRHLLQGRHQALRVVRAGAPDVAAAAS